MIHTEVIPQEQIAALANDWNRLAAVLRAQSPMLSAEWCLNWLDVYCGHDCESS